MSEHNSYYHWKGFPLHPQQEFSSGGWAAEPQDRVPALTSVEARSWMHIRAFPNGWCEGLLLSCHRLGGGGKKNTIRYSTCTHFIRDMGSSSRIKGICTLIAALENAVHQKQGSPVHLNYGLDAGANLTYRRVGKVASSTLQRSRG